MTAARAGVLLAALLSASCGAPLMTLPSGAGMPASDAAALLSQATRACSHVTTLSAQIASSLLLGQVALERFSPEGLAEVSGLRLAVGPDPGREGIGPLRSADGA